MKQVHVVSGLSPGPGHARAANILFATLMVASCLSFAAPGGNTGGATGGGNVTLSTLGCAQDEVARVTDAEEWDCDPGLTAVENSAADLDIRLGTLEGFSLDPRVSALELTADDLNTRLGSVETDATNLELRVGTLEGFTLDPRVSALELTADDLSTRLGSVENDASNLNVQVIRLDTRVNSLELTTDDLRSRLGLVEGYDLDPRLTQVETDTSVLDSRVSTLESTSSTFLRTLFVSPVGPTPEDNGNELMAALAEASSLVPAPSTDDPVLIKIEPGTYDVGAQVIQVPAFVSIKGSGPTSTVLRGSHAAAVTDVKHGTVLEGVKLDVLTDEGRAFYARTDAPANTYIKNVEIYASGGTASLTAQAFNGGSIFIRDIISTGLVANFGSSYYTGYGSQIWVDNWKELSDCTNLCGRINVSSSYTSGPRGDEKIVFQNVYTPTGLSAFNEAVVEIRNSTILWPWTMARNSATVYVFNSHISGWIVTQEDGVINVASSLFDTVRIELKNPNGGFKCINSYDANFNPFPECQ